MDRKLIDTKGVDNSLLISTLIGLMTRGENGLVLGETIYDGRRPKFGKNLTRINW